MPKVSSCDKLYGVTLKPTGFGVKWPTFGNLWSSTVYDTCMTNAAGLPKPDNWLVLRSRWVEAQDGSS